MVDIVFSALPEFLGSLCAGLVIAAVGRARRRPRRSRRGRRSHRAARGHRP
ncbi:hypothetical protein ACIRQY_30635 [Streptomyces sp. NPDC101490]|uniref:hypothetical protein n=1 Tax=unclassified Streptomyces TaxID=2593676 RepID=UPI003322CDD9